MMRRQVYDYFFLALLVLVLYGLLKLLAPFAGSLLGASLCAVTFYPMYKALHRWFPRLSPSLRAAISDVLVFIFFVTPLALLGWAILRESTALTGFLKQWTTTVAQWRDGNVLESMPWLTHIRSLLTRFVGMGQAQFQENLISGVNKVLQYLSLGGTLLATHAIRLVFDLMLMVFALFFMFRDGEKFFHHFQTLIPVRHENQEELSARLHDTMVGLVRGLFLTSLVQGVAATLGYLLIGVSGAVLLGAVTALMGMMPVVGTFAIWVPTGVYLLLTGSYGKGIFVLLWGAFVVVGLIDTVIRPYLVGKGVELPTYALFFALLGGVELWGAKGLILGPLLVAMVPALIDMYREQYLRRPDKAV